MSFCYADVLLERCESERDKIKGVATLRKVRKGDNLLHMENSSSVTVVCGVFLLLFLTAATDATWIEHGGRCYSISADNRSFVDATTACSNMGAVLLQVESEDEHDYITTITNDTTREYWVGLTHLGSGSFQWNDGTSPSATMWFTGEPNETGDCVRYFRIQYGGNTMSRNHLGDHLCTQLYYYICEKSADFSISKSKKTGVDFPHTHCPLYKMKTSQIRCAGYCNQEARCAAYTYNRDTKICEFYFWSAAGCHLTLANQPQPHYKITRSC